MAPASRDIGSLEPDQQASLEQYLAVTNQDVEAAIPLLERAQWNVQIAIARFFDGEPETDPIEELQNIPPADGRRQETLADTFYSSFSRTSRQPTAPRIVPSPNPEIAYRPGFPFNLILAPFNLATFFVSRFFRLLIAYTPFLGLILSRFRLPIQSRSSQRRQLVPQDTASRFIREFEEEYGRNDLPFLEKGYAHALDDAKKDLKYLLVVILSPEHDDTEDYVRHTLLAPEVVAYLRNKENNILLWGGTVQDAEAYQVSAAYRVTKFPYAAIVSVASSRSNEGGPSPYTSGMSVVASFSGPMPPADFLAAIRRNIDFHAPVLNRLRLDRAERDQARSIREQQDTAYERSLARDRERDRSRREKEAQMRRWEAEQQAAHERRQEVLLCADDWRRWRASRIQDEPNESDKNATRVSLRLQDGNRIVRRFKGNVQVEEVYALVECWDLISSGDRRRAEKPPGYNHEYPFRLVSPMPRTVYEVGDKRDIRELMGSGANLIVEAVDEEDE